MKQINEHISPLLVTLAVHGVLVGLFMLIKLSYPLPSSVAKEITLVPVGSLTQEAAASSGNNSVQSDSPVAPPSPEIASPSKKQPVPSRSSSVAKQSPTPIPAQKGDISKVQNKEATKSSASSAEMTQSEAQIGAKVSDAFGKSGNKGFSSGKGKTSPGGGGNSFAGWSLDGRSIVGNGGRPVTPSNVPDIRGTVNIRIIVDASGTVTEARLLPKGTNTTESRLIQAAIKAALATKFNPAPGAPDQQGSITYHFDVKS